MRRLSDGALFALVTVLLVAPLFWFRDLPLYDLPDHLARQEILFGGGAPGASQYYAANWRLVPNLAMESWVAVFHFVMPVEWAVRLFLAATIAQLFWGAIALNRALFGHTARFALAAALFAYNGPFLFGFGNLCFGLGMVLWATASWVKWREELWAAPAFAVVACLILLAHLFAFALYALVLLAFELGELRHGWRALRRELAALLHLLAPLGLYLFMPREVVLGGFAYAPWWQKLAGIAGAIGFYNPEFDLVCLLLLLVMLAFGLSRIHLAREMAYPILALIVAYAVLPHQLGEGSFVDYRVPAAVALFLCASLSWRESERRRRNVGDWFMLAVLLLRLGFMVSQWQDWQADYAEYRAAFAQLPVGARLLPLSADPNVVALGENPPLAHISGMAVSERGALVPDLFAERGHQLLVYREPYKKDFNLAPSAALAPDFDYVLLIRPETIPPAAIPPYQPLVNGRTFVLGKLTR